MKAWKTLLLGAAAALMLPAGEAFAQQDNRQKKSKDSKDAYKASKKSDKQNGKSRIRDNQRVRRFEELRVPPGHLPPPGECRMWFPGRPPGQQPPPEPCGGTPPPGAWVITHEGQRYRVNMFSNTKANRLEQVRYYLTR